MSHTEFTWIPIDLLIYSGRNPRTEMRNLEELAENIKEYGILEPIIVRPRAEKFEVVVGERRVRASIMAGLKEIPAIIRTLSDSQTDEVRLLENIHRDDLTEAEKGDAVYALLGNYPEKYPTIASVSKALNKPYSTVLVWTQKSKRISDHVRSLVSNRSLSEAHVAYLLKYDHETQNKLADTIVKKNIPSQLIPNFIDLYDNDPKVNLDKLADQVKGNKRVVQIEISKLPPQVRREIEHLVEREKEETKAARKEYLKKAREARLTPKPKFNRVKPEEVIRTKAEAIIERLDEIKHPFQRARMVNVIPKELEKIEKRLEKAPERRERVEPKLNRLYELKAEGIFLSTTWRIAERAEYAGSKDFHGNCPPQVVEQCVLRLTGKDDLVLDPMAGSGTAIDVCNLLDRRCIAYDIKPPNWRNDIIKNDSRKIPLDNNSIDMVFLHPPYWDMVYYTKAEEKLPDLSRTETLEQYIDMLKRVLQECHRVLKNGKYLCILLGDRIKEGKFIPLCRKTANMAEEIGFTDCGYAVKFTQGATSLMEKGQMIYAELAYTENLKVEHDLVMFFKKET